MYKMREAHFVHAFLNPWRGEAARTAGEDEAAENQKLPYIVA
jgi:hypothetical protein